MGKWSGAKVALIVLIAAVVGVAGGIWLSGRPTSGQTQVFQPPRLKGTDKPDLTGIWQSFTTANWDIQDHSAGSGSLPRAPRHLGRAATWTERGRGQRASLQARSAGEEEGELREPAGRRP